MKDFGARKLLAVKLTGRIKDVAGGLVMATYDAQLSEADSTQRIARAHLLPPYDEYTVAYQDRSAAGAAPKAVASAMESWLLSPNVVLDGKVAGVWKRTVRADRPTVGSNRVQIREGVAER